MDTRTAEQRSRIMRAVRTKDTGPEMVVRRTAHALGLRFRLNRKDLPGSPDLVFPKYCAAIFVHGCFWHGHDCSKGGLPKSRTEYWVPKIAANMVRDERKAQELSERGWRVLTLWQCELSSPALAHKVENFVKNRST